ncbi:WD40 repeat domain-containing protein [Nocardia australiensis]|uniref:WD40 repeat domain-containing protein n=1 Tax=Nocardia australiensis TaxID=2887191 RepID=UPI001D1423B0|nr:hypothetical protein [Nocardia australiensis]
MPKYRVSILICCLIVLASTALFANNYWNAHEDEVDYGAANLSWTLHGHDIAFSPDSRTLFAVDAPSPDKRKYLVDMWDTTSHERVGTIDCHSRRENSENLESGTISRIAVGPDNRALAITGSCTGDDSPIQLWDFKTNQLQRTLPKPSNWPQEMRWLALSFRPDGKLLGFYKNLQTAEENGIAIWDPATPDTLKTFPVALNVDPIYAIFSPDGNMLTITKLPGYGPPDRVILRNIVNDSEVADLRVPEVSPVAFSHDSHTLILGDAHSSVRLWDIGAHRFSEVVFTRLECPHHQIAAVGISPDGGAVAASPVGPGPLLLWNISNRRVVTTLPHACDNKDKWPRGDEHIEFSPDGHQLAVSNGSAQARVFEFPPNSRH